MHGRGVYTFNDGRVYDGEFVNAHKSGHGYYLWPDGSYYRGRWENGKRNGQGRMVWSGENIQYSGEWKDDSRVNDPVSRRWDLFFLRDIYGKKNRLL